MLRLCQVMTVVSSVFQDPVPPWAKHLCVNVICFAFVPLSTDQISISHEHPSWQDESQLPAEIKVSSPSLIAASCASSVFVCVYFATWSGCRAELFGPTRKVKQKLLMHSDQLLTVSNCKCLVTCFNCFYHFLVALWPFWNAWQWLLPFTRRTSSKLVAFPTENNCLHICWSGRHRNVCFFPFWQLALWPS